MLRIAVLVSILLCNIWIAQSLTIDYETTHITIVLDQTIDHLIEQYEASTAWKKLLAAAMGKKAGLLQIQQAETTWNTKVRQITDKHTFTMMAHWDFLKESSEKAWKLVAADEVEKKVTMQPLRPTGKKDTLDVALWANAGTQATWTDEELKKKIERSEPSLSLLEAGGLTARTINPDVVSGASGASGASAASKAWNEYENYYRQYGGYYYDNDQDDYYYGDYYYFPQRRYRVNRLLNNERAHQKRGYNFRYN